MISIIINTGVITSLCLPYFVNMITMFRAVVLKDELTYIIRLFVVGIPNCSSENTLENTFSTENTITDLIFWIKACMFYL